jgi:hypothetical protein
MDVMTAQSAELGETKMTIFTIDNQNNITAFATPAAAAAASTTPFDLFTDQKELADLLASWPAERLAATYNSLPGVKPLKSLQDPQTAASKIWERVEKLGQMVAPEPVAAKPAAGLAKKTQGGTPSAKGAPAKGNAGKKATPAKAAPQGKKAAQAQAAQKATESGGSKTRGARIAKGAPARGKSARQATAAKNALRPKPAAQAPEVSRAGRGSKKAEVIAMLRRKNGATLAEIMRTTGWQKHTVRGFMAGAMKQAGHAVESFKPAGGERTYRLK